jgi:type VII secretion integral membrane protein EccD
MMAKVSFPPRCAVAVVCGEHLVSQVYPAAVPIAVFIDNIVELLSGDLKRRGAPALDTGTSYELQRANGTRLDAAKTLDELGVEDGSTLILVPVEHGDSFEPHYESLSTGLARAGKRLFAPVTAQTAVQTAVALVSMVAAVILGLAVYTRVNTESLSASVATTIAGFLLVMGAFTVWKWWPGRQDLLTGFAWPAVPLIAIGFATAAPGVLGAAHLFIAALATAALTCVVTVVARRNVTLAATVVTLSAVRSEERL